MRLFIFDDLALPKLLLTEMNIILTNYFHARDNKKTYDLMGRTCAFVHRINKIYTSHEAILMTQLFEILKNLDKAQNDHSLSVILEAMVSPNPVAAEQIVEVMNCVKGFEEPGIIDESSDMQCILFSGVLGWVARKALEPTVSMEQRASLAISTAAVVSSLVFRS